MSAARKWGLALTLTLANASCLNVNPDYVSPSADRLNSTAPAPAPTSQVTPNLSTLSPKSADNTVGSPATSSSATTTTTTSLASSATSSTTGHTSSSSSSSSQTSHPVAHRDGTWKPIRLALNSAASAAENGYSVQLTFDHAQLHDQGAALGGQDLAIVYVKNNQLHNIDRVLDPESSWGQSNTRIWFSLQEPLSPGSQVDAQYYLVVGSTGFAPKQDPNGIFLMYDNFDNGVVNAIKWSEHTTGSATGALPQPFGVRLHASSLSGETQSRSIRSNWSARPDGVMAELRLRFPSDLNQSCNRLRPMAFESGTDHTRVGLGIQSGQWHRVNDSQASGGPVGETLSSIHVDPTWSRYALAWHGTTMQAWKDNESAFQRSSAGDSVPRPDTRNLHFRIHTSAATGACVSTSSSDIDIDWVWIRHYTSPEPSATLIP